jgi:hypothetical protein
MPETYEQMRRNMKRKRELKPWEIPLTPEEDTGAAPAGMHMMLADR